MRTKKHEAVVAMFAAAWAVACAGDQTITMLDGEQGGADAVVHLPRPEGAAMTCSQGAGGTYSHRAKSTRHDLDLDTPNTWDEELFAPASGILRVHKESASANFGVHANIDLGDGTYVILAHMKEIFLQDGVPVVEGQLLGYEGCTGLCTGDHVHMGLHQGDASKMGHFGVSVPLAYKVKSTMLDGGLDVLKGDEAACGTNSPSYQSGLKINRWHPNGTLLKTPGDAKVYRVDRGYLRHVATEDVFRSYGYAFAHVLTVSVDELPCYLPGADIAERGNVEAATSDDGTLWLFVAPRERADRYRIRVRNLAWKQVLQSWGVQGVEDAKLADMPADDARMHDWPERAGFAAFRDGSLLRENNAVYVVSDGAALVFDEEDDRRFMGYAEREPLQVPQGTMRALFTQVGDCRTTGLGCLSRFKTYACRHSVDLAWPPAQEPVESDGSGGSEDPPAQTQPPPPLDGSDAPPDKTIPETPASRTLTVRWQAPAGLHPRRIVLSGEARGPDGSFLFDWEAELVVVEGEDAVSFTLPDVSTGVMFRFSVEYFTAGRSSWSCMGPYPAHPTLQGKVMADVDGVSVPPEIVGDPTGATTGCGLKVTVP